jgi:hypothetical protein
MLGGNDGMKVRNYCPKCDRRLSLKEIVIHQNCPVCLKHGCILTYNEKRHASQGVACNLKEVVKMSENDVWDPEEKEEEEDEL